MGTFEEYCEDCDGVIVKPIFPTVAIGENDEHELVYGTIYQCPECKGISIRD